MTFTRKLDTEQVYELIKGKPEGTAWIAPLANELDVHKRTLKVYLEELEASGRVVLGYSSKHQGRPGWVKVTS